MSTACPTPFALERHLARERWSGANELATHVESCHDCQARLIHMQKIGDEYQATPEASLLRERLSSRNRVEHGAASRKPWTSWTLGLSMAMVAMVLAIYLVPSGRHLTAKGGGLSFVVQRTGARETWDERSLLSSGDRLQPVWTGKKSGYLGLMARSPSGEVEALFPKGADEAALIQTGEPTALGSSISIDAVANNYELWLFFAYRPFNLRSVRSDLERRASPKFEGQVQVVKLPVRP